MKYGTHVGFEDTWMGMDMTTQVFVWYQFGKMPSSKLMKKDLSCYMAPQEHREFISWNIQTCYE